MLNIHARNLTVCTWLKDILKSNWCHAILVKENCTFNYRRERKYWTWKLRASQILICLCVCISTYLCVYSVCFHMHTHPSVKLFDVIWKTRISWQGYFSILLLQLLSVPYMLYNLYFCKEIYPCARGIQEQPNSVRNKVLVFLSQLIIVSTNSEPAAASPGSARAGVILSHCFILTGLNARIGLIPGVHWSSFWSIFLQSSVLGQYKTHDAEINLLFSSPVASAFAGSNWRHRQNYPTEKN